MSGLGRRLAGYLRTTRTLSRAGATLSNLLLLPLRRRLPRPRSYIALRNGVSLTSPVGEPLAGLVEEVWLDRCYVPEPDSLTGCDIIVDIGAHVGVFTLWAAAHHPSARVIAVEPSSSMCSALRRNLAASGLGNVTVVEAACAGRAGEATLYSRGCEGMNSLYQRDNYGSSFRPLQRTVILTLDDLFSRFALARVDLLKLDCEGAEYEILFGAADATLARIDRIAMEYHVGLAPGSPDELAGFLTARGFAVRCSALTDEEGGYLHAARRR